MADKIGCSPLQTNTESTIYETSVIQIIGALESRTIAESQIIVKL